MVPPVCRQVSLVDSWALPNDQESGQGAPGRPEPLGVPSFSQNGCRDEFWCNVKESKAAENMDGLDGLAP